MKEFELNPEEQARIHRDMDSIYTGFHVDPGKHDRYLPKVEKPVASKPKGPRRGLKG